MSETSQQFVNTVVPTGNPKCLHCAIRLMVAKWIEMNCERAEDGTPKMSIEAIAVNMSMALAGYVEAIPAGTARNRAKQFSLLALATCLNERAPADFGTKH